MKPTVRPGELSLNDHAQDGRHTLTLLGELVLATVPAVEAKIVQLRVDGASEVVLDLRKLAFIDSAGLRFVLTSQELSEGQGCHFSLARGQAPTERLPTKRLFKPTALIDKLPFLRWASANSPSQDSRRPPAESR